MKNSRKKAVVAAALAFVMVFTTPGVVQATTKTTSVHSTIGTYTEYVRKVGSATELGQMTLSKTIVSITSDGVKVAHITRFKATLNCNSVTVYASYKNGDFGANTKSKMQSLTSISVSKTYKYATEAAAQVSKTYGKCSVTYN